MTIDCWPRETWHWRGIYITFPVMMLLIPLTMILMPLVFVVPHDDIIWWLTLYYYPHCWPLIGAGWWHSVWALWPTLLIVLTVLLTDLADDLAKLVSLVYTILTRQAAQRHYWRKVKEWQKTDRRLADVYYWKFGLLLMLFEISWPFEIRPRWQYSPPVMWPSGSHYAGSLRWLIVLNSDLRRDWRNCHWYYQPRWPENPVLLTLMTYLARWKNLVSNEMMATAVTLMALTGVLLVIRWW